MVMYIYDWKNKESVIAVAKRFGKGFTVVWNGNNYNIIHTVNEKLLLKGREVVFRTQENSHDDQS